MKKLITFIYIICCLQFAKAETYGNEWIDVSKTYYKFKVANNSIYRISYTTLAGLGIPTNQLIGSDFKMFRNGEEVPLYVTSSNQFTNNDFIEFYGKMNDGKVDSLLYKRKSDQVLDNFSLFSDSSTYYFTIDPFAINKRITLVNNDISLIPTPEAYCFHTVSEYPKTLSNGYPASVFYTNLFNSDYDLGEGLVFGRIKHPASFFAFPKPKFIYKNPNVNGFLNIRMALNDGRHEVRITQAPFDTTVISFNKGVKDFYFPINSLNIPDANAAFLVADLATTSDNYYVSNFLQYPRQLNADNQTNFSFSFKKKNELYFEMKNFNSNSTTPILYDLINNQRYIAEKDSVLKFHLIETTFDKEELYLSTQTTSDIPFITNIRSIKFTDINSIQGNYLIITNKKLRTSNNGVDYIDEYKKYRNSAAGGSNNAQVYYIDELTDLFGYGIAGHPIAIRNFINYAIDNFSIKPQHAFIIGKGLQYDYVYNVLHRTTPDYTVINRNLVPTYGEPASDNLLTARSAILNYPQVGTGRLDVINGIEIKGYLDKVKEYESALNDTFNFSETPFNKTWMKNVLHLGGGNNNFEQQIFRSYLEDSYKPIIEGPSYGGKVSSLYKNSTDPIQIAQNIFLDSLINEGVSLITFFGHSAPTTLDFNLVPERFENKGKYHLMLTNGCFVGSIFSEGNNSYSDRFILTPNKAAIGYIAPITLALSNILNSYSTSFYNKISRTMYNDKIGNILKETAKDMAISPSELVPLIGEQMIYHGDPGLRINTHFRPDYYIDQSSITFSPQNINASIDSFLVKVNVRNLGAVATDINGIRYYNVNIARIFPNGQIQNTSVRVPSAINSNDVYVWIKSDRINGPGINTFKIKVDYENEIPEYSEQNNEVTITKLILADDIIPIFPYDFCIVNDPNIELVFSTANNFAGPQKYIFQIDTTEFFNSPILTQTSLTQPGATIKWTPTIPKIQNTVYYFRATVDTASGLPSNWKTSSFLYNTALSTGWNQSHYFQYLKNQFTTLQLKQDRMFYYPNTVRTLQVNINGFVDQLVEAYFDGYLIARNGWGRRGFIFFVYDANTGKNWQTYQIGNSGRGPYGDITSNRYPTNVIEFITRDNNNGKDERKRAIDFLNSIPCNAYVLGYSFLSSGYEQWLSDSTSISDQTLFSAFESKGVTQIRNQVNQVPFVFFIHTCNPSFNPIQIQRNIQVDTFFTFPGTFNKGSMRSTIIGPAKNWKDFTMDWHATELNTYDDVNVEISGYDTAGIINPVATGLRKNVVNSLSNIDAKRYPYLQMDWETKDDSLGTAPQMDYWRITYDKAPEAVVNPTIHFVKTRDTIISGENYTMSIAVENVTPINMDSLLVKYTIRDASNNITIFYKRFGPLPGKQSINIDFTYNFANSNFFGINSVTIEVNPNDDQVEQFHFNNFATFNVTVLRDKINPLFDVTFDGRHIIDGEYVSANPEILFRLKDENKYLALNDTAGFLIFMYYPESPTIPIQIQNNQSDITFIPADPSNLSKNNEARLIYKPTLKDGTYEIRAQGIDRSKNDAGRYDYRIKFKVDSKPTITNILNYPNPFSTSTQFVFTLTGATIPEQIIIQIFSATGKVVKEITREQLGNLHIGTNVTDYKWDGTDNYGDRLANGVYFYRVMTRNIDGTTTEVKQSTIDKYFKNGYGKLYIIR